MATARCSCRWEVNIEDRIHNAREKLWGSDRGCPNSFLLSIQVTTSASCLWNLLTPGQQHAQNLTISISSRQPQPRFPDRVQLQVVTNFRQTQDNHLNGVSLVLQCSRKYKTDSVSWDLSLGRFMGGLVDGVTQHRYRRIGLEVGTMTVRSSFGCFGGLVGVHLHWSLTENSKMVRRM